jgi:hypothetical protein
MEIIIVSKVMITLNGDKGGRRVFHIISQSVITGAFFPRPDRCR